MKKLLIFIVLGILAWHLYESKFKSPNYSEIETSDVDPELNSVEPESEESFECDGRQHCSQMTSRAEAEFFNKNCPNTKMDGDHDGEPCENDSRW